MSVHFGTTAVLGVWLDIQNRWILEWDLYYRPYKTEIKLENRREVSEQPFCKCNKVRKSNRFWDNTLWKGIIWGSYLYYTQNLIMGQMGCTVYTDLRLCPDKVFTVKMHWTSIITTLSYNTTHTVEINKEINN